MATRRMQKLSAVWMLLAVLSLLLLTPFRNISALRVNGESSVATHQISAEDAMEFAQDKSNLGRRLPVGGGVSSVGENWQEPSWQENTFGTGGF